MNHFMTDLLNLRENFYEGQIPSTIGDLPQTLAFLDLSANQWTGTIPTEAGRLLQLTDLRLALSDRAATPDGFCAGPNNPLGCLSGTIPTELGLLVNLKSLWLFSNNLSGMLPTQISNLASLEELFLDKNEITGPVPTLPGALGECVLPACCFHCSDLLAQTLPLHTVNIDLSTNFFGPDLPTQLFQMPTIRFLSLGVNTFVDEFPQTFNLPVVETIILRQNNLTTVLPTTLGELTTLQRLDISFLLLTGTIPTEVGNMAALIGFDCQANVMLNGTIPIQFSFLPNLQLLNLNFNSLRGALPLEIVFAQSLVLLDFGFNFLTGKKMAYNDGLMNCCITTRDLGKSQFEFRLLFSFIPCSPSQYFFHLGTIPTDYGSFPLLQVFDLRGNALQGSIPTTLAQLTLLQEIHLNVNQLAGPIPTELAAMPQLFDIELSNNTLTGAIPSEIGLLTALIRFDASINLLTSTIPVTLSQLPALGTCVVLCCIVLRVKENCTLPVP